MKELSARQSTEIRAENLCEMSEKRGRAVFSNFLNEQEQFYAQEYLERRGVVFSFDGGSERCVRKILRVSSYEEYGEEEPFPIFPLTLKFRKADKPAHGDFLGSFMGLGIKREMIGDIIVCEGFAVVFCTKTARDVIYNGISRVGRVGVTITEGVSDELPEAEFRDVTVIAASMRADCIVSGVTGLSREKTAEFIKAGHFTLNYEECTNVSKNLSQGDVFSLRGYGKFTVESDAGQTKKGRAKVLLKKYG